ncbi:unnamed protein product [Discosporangium mesarthrocarpum]
MDQAPPPQMSGYLQKKAKTGKWQKRWFETNAHYLTYYKTKKMEKLLAALNLPQVGEIRLVDPDEDPHADEEEENNGCLFTIELNDRIYTMKAGTREEAARWVEVLKVLQTLESEESKASEEPTASMMRGVSSSGTVNVGAGPNSNSSWSKDPFCCGLCACLTPADN